MRAVGYVRISKLDQETTSPQRQRRAIQKLCADRGWDVVKVYEDLNVSAFNGKHRPGFEAMMARLDEVDAVVFWRLDRLSRSVVGVSQVIEACEAAGTKLVTTDQSPAHSIDTTTASSRAFVQMSSVFAELESRTLSERAKQMHAHLRERGVPVGRIPYGWRKVDGKLVKHPDEQATLAEAARRYVAGESLRRISGDLGLHHPNLGRRLRSQRVMDALPADVSGPLAQALAERGRTGTRAKRSLLGGIAKCSTCGAGMTVVGSGKRARGSYACRDSHVSISRPWLDAYVSREVVEAISSWRILDDRPGAKPKRKGMPSKGIEARLDLLEVDHYEKGMIPRDRFLRRREALLGQLAAAKDQEQDAGVTIPPFALGPDLAAEWNGWTLHERRQVITGVLHNVDVRRAKDHGPIKAERVKLDWRMDW